MDNTTQPWWQSKTVIGAIVGLAAPIIGGLLHVTVSNTDITQVTDVLAAIGLAAGNLVAVYGRIKATKKIG